MTTTMVDKLPRSIEFHVAPSTFCLAEKLGKQGVGEIEGVGNMLPHMIHSCVDFATTFRNTDPLCYRGMAELDSKWISQAQKVLYSIESICKVVVIFRCSHCFSRLITYDGA